MEDKEYYTKVDGNISDIECEKLFDALLEDNGKYAVTSPGLIGQKERIFGLSPKIWDSTNPSSPSDATLTPLQEKSSTHSDKDETKTLGVHTDVDE